MELKIKKLHSNAIIPTKAHPYDVGWDVYALKTTLIHKDETMMIRTGIAIEPPTGFYMLVVPRSSIVKTGLIMHNSIGVIDQNFRGEILVPLRSTCLHKTTGVEIITSGDRIAQLLLMHQYTIPIIEVQELSQTDRGTQGFGSSGR